MTTSSRVRVYNRAGRALATLNCHTERSWVLDGEGLATITMTISDNKVRQSLLQYGNLITIEHDTLPLWAGVIDPERTWGDNKLVITAWGAEYILRFRRSVYNQSLTNMTTGTIFSKLIASANSKEDTRVRAGNIYMGGVARDETLDGKSVYDHIISLASRSGYNWNVEGAWNASGELYFPANLYLLRGVKAPMRLNEGFNISPASTPLIEQGFIVNDLLGLGDGDTPDTRITTEGTDKQSVSNYGLRQSSEDFAGNTQAGTLSANVMASIASKKNPSKLFQISAFNVGNTYKHLRIGNTMPLTMRTVGFLAGGQVGITTTVRIIGMKYNDDLDQVNLILQEYI